MMSRQLERFLKKLYQSITNKQRGERSSLGLWNRTNVLSKSTFHQLSCRCPSNRETLNLISALQIKLLSMKTRQMTSHLANITCFLLRYKWCWHLANKNKGNSKICWQSKDCAQCLWGKTHVYVTRSIYTSYVAA